MDSLLDVSALAAIIEQPNLSIWDCRFDLADPHLGRNLYQQAHIPNADFVDLERDLSGQIIPGETGRHPLPALPAIATLFSRLGISHDSHIVCYDQGNSVFAARAWWICRWLGLTQVQILDGGFNAWTQHHAITTRQRPTKTVQPMALVANDEMVVDAARLMQTLKGIDAAYVDRHVGRLLKDQPPWQLIDARNERRFLGLEEPIDPISGHIPGARCFDFQQNLDSNGCFLSKSLLQVRFQDLGPIEQIVCYCGSGVTACHNIFAINHAGLGMAKLYPGSWSEWIIDRQRPVALTAGA